MATCTRCRPPRQLDLLAQAADGAIQPRRTTFVNFFDNLFWEMGRGDLFWNYEHMLEAYVPAAKRKWGYFCLDILHGDRFVGRFDPKVERKTGTLILKALYLEPDVAPDDALVADVAVALRDFMAFHHATELVIDQSTPPEFGAKLLASIRERETRGRDGALSRPGCGSRRSTSQRATSPVSRDPRAGSAGRGPTPA